MNSLVVIICGFACQYRIARTRKKIAGKSDLLWRMKKRIKLKPDKLRKAATSVNIISHFVL
jgi:hypothetical protein